jgi:hypothetical protein
MTMVVRMIGVALLFVLASGPSSSGDDVVVGIVWEIKFEHETDSKKDVVERFRATPDGKVWNVPQRGKPKQLGTWSGDVSDTKITFTAPPPGPRRTVEIVQVRKNPPGWQGIAIKENGDKRTCKVRLIED